MLEIIRNGQGEILGACEFYVVDSKGNYDSKGEYCWINEVEVSKSQEHKGLLKEFIRLVIAKVPNCKWGYFWRKRKYESRPPRIYSRERWLKLIR